MTDRPFQRKPEPPAKPTPDPRLRKWEAMDASELVDELDGVTRAMTRTDQSAFERIKSDVEDGYEPDQADTDFLRRLHEELC